MTIDEAKEILLYCRTLRETVYELEHRAHEVIREHAEHVTMPAVRSIKFPVSTGEQQGAK